MPGCLGARVPACLRARVPACLHVVCTHKKVLVNAYKDTLAAASAMPVTAVYRQSIEAITNHRLAIVESVSRPAHVRVRGPLCVGGEGGGRKGGVRTRTRRRRA